MVLNYIWVAFFGIAFLIAAGKLVFAGDAGVFPAIMDSTFSSAKTAFEISLGLTGVLSLWMGIMKIGEKAEWSTFWHAVSARSFANSSRTFPRTIPSSETFS